MVKTSQLQNGLRHGDYRRYRQYCGRRLRRIRKSERFLHGKGKSFVHKKVTATQVAKNSLELLYLPLFNTERAWGYAMQLRADEKNEDYGADEALANSRIKFHLSGRLAKAAVWSKQLLTLCSATCDTRTCLEAEAYAGYMAGNVALYREEWDLALSSFSTCHRIYSELAKVGTLEQRDVLSQMLEEIRPYIRYCEYNLKVLSNMENGDASETSSFQEENAGSANNTLLQSKLDKVFQESMKKQAQSQMEIQWRGETIPVRSESLRLAVLAPNQDISLLESLDVSQQAKREHLYFQILRHFDQGLRQVRLEQERFAQMKRGALVDSQRAELDRLEEYIRFMKLRQLLNRNLMIMRQVRQQEASSAQDMVHILDMILQNVEEMQCIPGTREDAEEGLMCQARAATYSALRCFYLAQMCAGTLKFGHAIALYERAYTQCDVATELNRQRTVLAQEARFDEESLLELPEEIAKLKSRALARRVLHSSAVQNDLSQQLQQQLQISQKEAKTYLMDDLGAFQARELIDMTPQMEAVPCKPILFDMAHNYLEFPDLSKRMMTAEQLEKEKEAEKNPSLGFFGWLRS